MPLQNLLSLTLEGCSTSAHDHRGDSRPLNRSLRGREKTRRLFPWRISDNCLVNRRVPSARHACSHLRPSCAPHWRQVSLGTAPPWRRGVNTVLGPVRLAAGHAHRHRSPLFSSVFTGKWTSSKAGGGGGRLGNWGNGPSPDYSWGNLKAWTSDKTLLVRWRVTAEEVHSRKLFSGQSDHHQAVSFLAEYLDIFESKNRNFPIFETFLSRK